MKRSEFEDNVRNSMLEGGLGGFSALDLTLKSIMAAADAAHAPWDPEEPELPERLEVYGLDRLACSGGRPWGSRVAAETKRRYNAWPKLRERAEAFKNSYAIGADILARAMLRILDGKEEGS